MPIFRLGHLGDPHKVGMNLPPTLVLEDGGVGDDSFREGQQGGRGSFLSHEKIKPPYSLTIHANLLQEKESGSNASLPPAPIFRGRHPPLPGLELTPFPRSARL